MQVLPVSEDPLGSTFSGLESVWTLQEAVRMLELIVLAGCLAGWLGWLDWLGWLAGWPQGSQELREYAQGRLEKLTLGPRGARGNT